MGSGSEDLVLIQYYYSIHNMDLNYLAAEPFRLRGSGPYSGSNALQVHQIRRTCPLATKVKREI